ncbi:MAG: YggT family protein [Candidatus Schekmanbacteria bacterium]|nr:YggT family protein [Candidatus Schekmanbacteria bacterium]
MLELLADLLNIALEFFLVCLVVRFVARERDLYFNQTLGLVTRVTDPVVMPLRKLPFRFFSRDFTPLFLVFALLVARGLVLPFLPMRALLRTPASKALITTAYAAVPGSLLGVIASFLRGIDLLFQILIAITMIWALLGPFANPIARVVHMLAAPLSALRTRLRKAHAAVPAVLAILALSAAHFGVSIGILAAVTGGAPVAIVLATTCGLLFATFELFVLVLIVYALLTWFSPDPLNPLVQLFSGLSQALVRPFRGIPLRAGRIDFTPLVAILAYSMLITLADYLVQRALTAF